MPRPPIERTLGGMTRRILAGLLLAGLVGACGSTHSTAHVATASGSSRNTTTIRPASTAQLVHSAAQCIRDHGISNFPDPSFDTQGHLQIDDQVLKTVPAAVAQSAEQACAAQINAAQSLVDASHPPATPEEIAQLTRFAQCMRAHGWPNFPDPSPDGRFYPAPGAGPPSKTDPAWQTCRSQLPTVGK
jgi:hypothetical protein